jgi:hypothetical protein
MTTIGSTTGALAESAAVGQVVGDMKFATNAVADYRAGDTYATPFANCAFLSTRLVR